MALVHLKVYRIDPAVEIPKYQTGDSACFDIAYNNATKHEYKGYQYNNNPFVRAFSDERLLIAPGERVFVPTGLIFDIPSTYSLRIHPRSSVAVKQGLVLCNCEGVIDADYTDELFLLVVNTSFVNATLRNGDRIAQAEIVRQKLCTIVDWPTPPLQKTDRVGGIGSTGLNTT